MSTTVLHSIFRLPQFIVASGSGDLTFRPKWFFVTEVPVIPAVDRKMCLGNLFFGSGIGVSFEWGIGLPRHLGGKQNERPIRVTFDSDQSGRRWLAIQTKLEAQASGLWPRRGALACASGLYR